MEKHPFGSSRSLGKYWAIHNNASYSLGAEERMI